VNKEVGKPESSNLASPHGSKTKEDHTAIKPKEHGGGSAASSTDKVTWERKN